MSTDSISGYAAEWLARRRDELNQRFDRAKRRHPALDAQSALDLLGRILPPLAGPEPEADTLLSSVFDVALLHLGRDAFAARPGLRYLLTDVFLELRPLLLLRPSRLVPSLSNAVENMGLKGGELASWLRRLGPSCRTPEELLDLGAVLAWRLGEARLRQEALLIAERMSPRLALDALGLSSWPEDQAEQAIASLRTDAWRYPTAPLRDEWTLVQRIGDFTGFGGPFLAPPLVLDGGSRHEILAEAGGTTFRIHADIFGHVAIRDPTLKSELGVRIPRGDTARLPGMAGATSFTELEGMIAFTRADSHRISILWRARAEKSR